MVEASSAERSAGGARSAYIAGALTSVADVPRARLFYELIAEIAAACGLVPYLPHRATDPVVQAEADPRSVYAIDRAYIERSVLVIAYAGTPSFGVGIEVEIAREHGVPVILVAERDAMVSRLLVGSPAVVEVVRFGDLGTLRTALAAAIGRARPEGVAAVPASPQAIVQRFLGRLGAARELPAAELAALLRVAEVDGDVAARIRRTIDDGQLFGAGLRDLVGRYALRGPDLAAFVLHDVAERPLAEIARSIGADPRTVRRRLGAARVRLGLAEDSLAPLIGQWLVTELIAPPTRALQLRLFANRPTDSRTRESHEQGPEEAEDRRQTGLAVQKGEPRPQAGHGPRQA